MDRLRAPTSFHRMFVIYTHTHTQTHISSDVFLFLVNNKGLSMFLVLEL